MDDKHLSLMIFVLIPAVAVSQCPFAPQLKELNRVNINPEEERIRLSKMLSNQKRLVDIHNLTGNRVRFEHDGSSSIIQFKVAQNEQNSDKLEAFVDDSILECSKLTYRTYNGYCNNLKVPERGMANNYYARLLPPSEYRNQSALPTPKSISKKLYVDKPITEKDYSLASMQYGQFVAHDISNRIMPPSAEKQKTSVTSYLDLSVIYGNSKKIADSIRLFEGGLLKTEVRQGQEFPESLENPTAEDNCSGIRDPGESCYDMGDTRGNQNPQLAVIHILFIREHNRIARKLSEVNPHWCDEKVYQEARKINIAQHQHIAFYQYLPIVLGRKNMIENKIIHDAEGFVDDYDEDIDASALDEHGTAAFRYYHTQIAGHLRLINDTHHSIGALRITDYIGRPQIIEKGDNFLMLSMGLALQQSMGVDIYHDEEITKYIFKEGKQFGEDLKAIDINRDRQHLLAPYNAYRKVCGMTRAKDFEDFKDVMASESVQSLSELYAHPDDVDLTVGGSLEKHLPGTWSGPTFHCILMKQFYNTRVGDRYWYEHSGELGFTMEQLKEIRKSSMSKLLCENANISKIQRDCFYIPHAETNPETSCDQLPSVNLNLWKESKSEP